MSIQRILVIEDEEIIREMLQEHLEKLNFQVRLASDGNEGLALLRDGKHPAPDLILLDLMMPGMDGRAFLKLRQRDPSLSAIPVIVLTAATDDPRALGADYLLRKPFRIAALVEVLRKVEAARRLSPA